MPLTPSDAAKMAADYFETQSRSLAQWLKLADVAVSEMSTDPTWSKKAAFNLHQATETAYACFLLVRTLYFPRSHNIKFLRSLAEDKEPRLIEAWPRASKAERRRFELLKRAYVDARYSPSYEISREDLDALSSCVRRLRDLVETVSLEQIDQLREAAR